MTFRKPLRQERIAFGLPGDARTLLRYNQDVTGTLPRTQQGRSARASWRDDHVKRSGIRQRRTAPTVHTGNIKPFTPTIMRHQMPNPPSLNLAIATRLSQHPNRLGI